MKIVTEYDGASQFSRRRFLANTSTLAVASLFGIPQTAAAEPPPETTRIRLSKIPGICIAPQYIAEPLLRAEGFTDVRYVAMDASTAHAKALASGEVDASINYAALLVISLDPGEPIVVLAGVHVGCFELIGNERVRTVRDLKGRSVGLQALGSSPHVFLASMAAYVGLDARRDIIWVTQPSVRPKVLFEQGKIDAFLGFPPEPQELRSRGIGRSVVNSALDRPWSQYFCCTLAANREFVERNPVATKRLVRAILKATDLCGAEPARAAQLLVDRGFTTNQDYALQAVREMSYARWREYSPEDTIRFWALRLREAEMIKSTPQKLITNGTDWRFLNELKRELKA